MIRRPPRSTLDRSSAASDVYKRQHDGVEDVDDGRLDAVGQHEAVGGHAAQPLADGDVCLLYTSPSPRDRTRYRMPSSA